MPNAAKAIESGGSMKHLTHEALRELLQTRPGPCVSVYMNVQRGPEPLVENGVHLRSLLDKARREAVKADGQLDLCHGLEELSELWDQPMAALAVFCAPDFLRTIPLPRPV